MTDATVVPQEAVLVLPSNGAFDSRAYRIARTLVERGHTVTILARLMGDVPAEETHPLEPVPDHQTPLHVLVAEDNSVNQRLALRLLEKRGHRVKIVGNGAQAIEALAQDDFDVVLMDVQMPEMDGFQATAAIREQERASGDHMPIIAMTAHAMRGDRERCLEAGMDDYISKPLRAEDFYQVVEGRFAAAAKFEDKEGPAT